MSLTLPHPLVVIALVCLLTAGCTRRCYRLPDDYDESPPCLGELSQHDATQNQDDVAKRPWQSTSIAEHDEATLVETAWDGQPQPEGQAEASRICSASCTQIEWVADRDSEQEELLPPLVRVEGDGELEEIALPHPSADEGEMIVVSIPARPPGLINRFLNFIGCSHLAGRSPHATEIPLSIETPNFSSRGEVPAPDRWWTTFGNSALDYQIESSLGGSLTLTTALQRLRAAQALARREASDLWLHVNGVGDAAGTVRTYAPNGSLFALGLDASYQVDLWGQIGSRVEAEQLRASATEADYHAVALTLSAEIARTWFTLVEAHAQLALLGEQLDTNLTGLKLQEIRFGGGGERIGSADVLRQRQLVESTREQVVIARARVDVLEHRLAVLQGRPPQRATYYVGSDLPAVPPLPATGLPSELVQRRPDVQRDYLALLAADRDLASAISSRYPRLNLSGSLTTLADNSANIFQDWLFVIAGQLVTPLVDGGQRRAEVDRNAAVLKQLVADYGQTVLIAFGEVEDALAVERHQRQRIVSLDKQYELARQASEQLRDRYFRFGQEIGETEYLDVLTATTTEQRLQRDIVSAKLDLILTRIALYLALAGGFDPHPQVIDDG